MKLYKFVSDKRIDILIKGQIRFSQPSVWNDPFEYQPYYMDHVPKYPFQQLYKLAELIKCIQENKEVPLKEIEEYESERKRITRDDIYRFIDKNIIGLSLTEDRDNLLMWSHYAGNHSGFVIEFDTSNNFFQSSDKFLFKVSCDSNRPNFNTIDYASIIVDVVGFMKENKAIPESYFSKIANAFRKSNEWEYEKEWRLITTTDKATNYIDFKNDLNNITFGEDSEINRSLPFDKYLALLDIPISCIKSIYCGMKMKRSIVRKLYFLTKYNPLYSHINLMYSEIDERLYKLNYNEVKEFDVLSTGEFIYEQSNKKKNLTSMLNFYIRRYEKEINIIKKIKPAGNMRS